jgi:hypothetical protein
MSTMTNCLDFRAWICYGLMLCLKETIFSRISRFAAKERFCVRWKAKPWSSL